MATDRVMEMVVSAKYSRSLKHLQRLLMDAEACAKNYGKRSLFGGDKFLPKFSRFQSALAVCALALSEDGYIQDVKNPVEAIGAIDAAMKMMERTYSSWPLAFEFWEVFRAGKIQ